MKGLLFCVLLLSVWANEALFQDFIKQHGRNYQSSEYSFRLKVFNANLKKIQALNDNSKHATFAANKFADMTSEEFKAQKLGSTFTPQAYATSCLANGVSKTADSMNYSPKEIQALPDAFDWRTTGGKGNKGIVSPVKDQGQCGSCWTFSSTGAIESAWAKKGNDMVVLSEQLIVDCSHGCSNMPGYGPVCNAGCNGGFQWNAFLDIINWGGLVTEAQYPYTGETGTCHMPPKSQLTAPIKNYTCLSGPDPANEEQLRAFILNNGPVAIAMDAGVLQFYFGGIVDPFFPNLECDPNSLDHALLIVGWGQERNWVGTMTPYWIVKNSWSASWGDSGYFLIARNMNLCGLANAVSAVVM